MPIGVMAIFAKTGVRPDTAGLGDSSGQLTDFLANTIGAYHGAQGEGLSAGGHRFPVDADESRTITIMKPRGRTAVPPPHTYTG